MGKGQGGTDCRVAMTLDAGDREVIPDTEQPLRQVAEKMTRAERLTELLEEFPVDPDCDEVDMADVQRYAGVQRDGRGGATDEFSVDVFDSVEDALEFVGGEIMAEYPWVPEIVVDLDTGERLQLTVTTQIAS